MSALVKAIASADEVRKQRSQTQIIDKKQKKRRYTRASIKKFFNRNKKVTRDHYKDEALRIYAINVGDNYDNSAEHVTENRNDSSLIPPCDPIAARGA